MRKRKEKSKALSTTSRPTSVLLDKSVVREALRGVQKRLSGRPLPDRQLLCLAAIVALRKRQIPTYITEEILNLLVELKNGLQKTILMVTHDPRAAVRAERVLHLDKGKLVREAFAGMAGFNDPNHPAHHGSGIVHPA